MEKQPKEKRTPRVKTKRTKNLVFERDAFSADQVNALFDRALIDTQAIIDNVEGYHSQEVVDEAKLEIEKIRDRKARYNEPKTEV